MDKFTKEQILSIAKLSGARKIDGVLGDIEGCSAYEEGTKLDGDNGLCTKFFGIKQIYKEITDINRIDRSTITKKAFIELISCGLPFILFRPKRLLLALARIYRSEGGLKYYSYYDYEYCPAVREIKRSVIKCFHNEKTTKRGVKEIRSASQEMVQVIDAIASFLQNSHSYKFRVQDIFGEIDKEAFIKSPLTETLRLKRIFMNREVAEKKKMEYFWRLIFLFILTNRRLVVKFIKELDIDKVKLDDNDYYYCLRRKAYDFKGVILEARIKLAEQIDEENNNIILGI